MDTDRETATLLSEMVVRAIDQHLPEPALVAARAGVWPRAAWEALVAQGLPRALVEGDDGFGIPLMTGLSLIAVCGRGAVPLPIAETMMANLLLSRAGLPTRDGPIAMIDAGVSLRREGDDWVATGVADRVAWGRDAAALLIEHDGRLALVTTGFETVATGTNLAAMPRDTVRVAGRVAACAPGGIAIRDAGALLRAIAMAGALEALVGMTIAHVTERRQFGRPLAAFQVVQHMLASLAAEAAAAAAAAGLAAGAFADAAPVAHLAIAAARARIGEAAGTAAGHAHQLHGALGMAAEHRLHRVTTALWSWRDEFGTAAWWTRELGRAALDRSRASLWPLVTSL